MNSEIKNKNRINHILGEDAWELIWNLIWNSLRGPIENNLLEQVNYTKDMAISSRVKRTVTNSVINDISIAFKRYEF